jgi:hypothetical protein
VLEIDYTGRQDKACKIIKELNKTKKLRNSYKMASGLVMNKTRLNWQVIMKIFCLVRRITDSIKNSIQVRKLQVHMKLI